VTIAHDLTGQRFGRLTALALGPPSLRGCLRWTCVCDCGATTTVTVGHLRSGHTSSCGCNKRIWSATHNDHKITHGCSKRGPQRGTYISWGQMKARCLNPKAPNFRLYGERGITVCARWLDSFENFLADMGRRPHGTSIDRIDNSGNYEPGNCRWATPTEQGANRRTSRRLTYAGKTLTAAEWGRALGGDRHSVLSRLRHGWSIERAVTTPLRPNGGISP
jgi:hypothetical protein